MSKEIVFLDSAVCFLNWYMHEWAQKLHFKYKLDQLVNIFLKKYMKCKFQT